MTTDISEKGLETLITRHMTGTDGLAPVAEGLVAETPDALAAARAAGSGWLAGNPKDYDRTYAFDVPQLFLFLHATQSEPLKKLGIADYKDTKDTKDINRQKFLARLSNEIGKRGVIDVLRKGVDHGPLHFDLSYGTPSPRNAKAAALYAQNRFSVTRQLRYSQDETRRALDLCLFINGLPFSTFELKNSLTKKIVEEKNAKTGRKKCKQVFPRFHQRDVVHEVLAHVSAHGPGARYLIEHSAGSGKSNSIAWLAHQLIALKRDEKEIFDSVIVVTDRRILDDQIQKTVKQFMQVGATVGHAEHSGDLRKFIEEGKKIIISTVQKFPFILDEIEKEANGKTIAIIIDEAHSSQGGKTSSAMSAALADPEDTVNDALEKRMQARKMLTNASYFAFTATPKNKTLEMFGQPLPPDAAGKVKHRPFHTYTMKQAIQEGFILDVLKSYTPVDSYYKLVKKIEGDPEFDTKRAQKKLRKYVESHDHAIRLKAEIMVDHFHEQVMALNKIGGKARAMLVCSGIERAVHYFHAFKAYLQERKSPYQAIVAFSGEHEFGGAKASESSLNGFPGGDIAEKIQEDPYRFLICADKFQTGYDEPLLHTMYVDKPLSGIKAVQTLSRLNRAHPEKHDVFVLDFQNNTETITLAFADYYRTTVLSEETDPNKLHDLKAALDNAQVYSPEQVQTLVDLFLSGAERDKLDPILDNCVAPYLRLDEDGQVDFKGKAKTFVRTYDFLASLLPYTNREWERLSIVLNLLIPKLPAPRDEDLSKGILEAIDMDSYRVEKRAVMKIALPDDNAEIGPVPVEGGGHKREPELDRLSNILKAFNDHFGTLFADADRVARRIKEDIAPKVAADPAYQNAKKNTPHTARMAHDMVLGKVMQILLKDDTQVYKQFVENESFRRFVTDMVFTLTSD